MFEAEIKSKAIDLRSRGKTYSDINTKLGTNIPKGTLSGWFKNIELSDYYQKKLQNNIDRKLHMARLKAWKVNRQKRLKFLKGLEKKNIKSLKLIKKPVQKILLSILYLAEGSKHKSSKFLNLGSSDPEIIKLYLFLLRGCFDLDDSKFRARIQCRADQDKKSLIKFWRHITNISVDKFYPVYVDKRTIGIKTMKKEYKGVCSIIYFDTSIQLELEILYGSVIKYLLKGR